MLPSINSLKPSGDIANDLVIGAPANLNTFKKVADKLAALGISDINGLAQAISNTVGAQGPKGEKGDPGFQGPAGATGPAGPQGIQGPKGDKGDQGDAGPQGAMGLQGARGIQGIQGIQGIDGPRGLQGITGPQGIQGIKGSSGDSVDPKDYGAKGDGIADDSAAWQAAINTGKVVIPSDGTYLINTSVTLPAGAAIFKQGNSNSNRVKIVTTANINTFVASGHNGSIQGIAFYHTGNGNCFRQGNWASWRITSNYFEVHNDGSVASDIIFTSGPLSWYTFNAFNNYRPNVESFCIAFDKHPNDEAHCIENHVDMNYVGGTGPGWYVGSRAGRSVYNITTKPEGIHFTNNTIQTFNYSLVCECVLELHLSGNSWCISNGTTILIRPTGPGLIDVRSTGNWYDSTGNPNVSAVILHDESFVNGPGAVFKVASFKDFIYGGKYGAALGPSASNVSFAGSSFLSMSEIGLACNQSKNITVASDFSFCPRGVSLIDGPNGGPFFMGNCSFDDNGRAEFVMTDKSKFIVSYETSGIKLARKFNYIGNTDQFTAASAGNSSVKGYVSIPHGLASTPNVDKCHVTIRSTSGALFEGATVFITGVDNTNITLGVYIQGLVYHGTIGYNLDVSI